MSYALLFSGQGTQHPGMLPWLEAEPASQVALQAMAALLGPGWRSALDDAHRRSSNAVAQPLIVGTALAAWGALAAQLSAPPVAVAGYSVGELAAFAAAAVLSVPSAIALAAQRAALMDAAVAGAKTGLLSVSGLHPAQVLQAQPALQHAIDIGWDQGIYAAEVAQLDAAALALGALGALCKPLEVRVASHSRFMDSAAQGFAAQLEGVVFSRPQSAVVLNASGSSTRNAQILRQALSAQIASTVRWAACMDALAEQCVACVMEVGAGSTLAKMWNQRHPAIPARALAEFRDVAGAARWLERRSV